MGAILQFIGLIVVIAVVVVVVLFVINMLQQSANARADPLKAQMQREASRRHVAMGHILTELSLERDEDEDEVFDTDYFVTALELSTPGLERYEVDAIILALLEDRYIARGDDGGFFLTPLGRKKLSGA